MEKFSVLMSVYHKEKGEFLEKCLESILVNQTLKPNEVIIVKDGPLTEELDEVLNKYFNMFSDIIKLVALPKNKGLGEALNIGMSKCTNDIIVRADSDDISFENRFERQVAYMSENKDVAVCSAHIIEFDADYNDAEQTRIKRIPVEYEEIVKYSKHRNPINHNVSCFRKKDIEEAGGYKQLLYCEDYYLWLRVLVAGKKAKNIDEPLLYARVGNGFNSRRGNKEILQSWKTLQEYMYDNKYINGFTKLYNMLTMRIFVCSSDKFRNFIYKYILRKGK